MPDVRTRAFITVERVSAGGGMDLVRAAFVANPTPLHSHPEIEIGVVTSGHRLVRCRGRCYPSAPGSIVVFAPGEVHSGAPLAGGTSTYRGFLVPPATLGQVAGWPTGGGVGPGSPWFEEPVFRDPGLARRLVSLHRGLAGGLPDPAGEVAGALGALAARHCRWTIPATPSGDHAAVARVRAYLETHYASKVQLGTLAEVAGLSVFHLIRIFRAATGVPPYAFLEQIRINRAAAMLREGLPVSRIAFLTGFADQSHLTRFFKRLVGVPPGRYQRAACRSPVAFG